MAFLMCILFQNALLFELMQQISQSDGQTTKTYFLFEHKILVNFRI